MASASRVKTSTTLKQPDPPPRGQGILQEVERPLLVRPVGRARPPPPVAGHAFARPAPDGQTFFAVEPFDPLVVDDDPLPPQQHVQPPVAEARALRRQLPQPPAQRCVVASAPPPVAHRRARQSPPGGTARRSEKPKRCCT